MVIFLYDSNPFYRIYNFFVSLWLAVKCIKLTNINLYTYNVRWFLLGLMSIILKSAHKKFKVRRKHYVWIKKVDIEPQIIKTYTQIIFNYVRSNNADIFNYLGSFINIMNINSYRLVHDYIKVNYNPLYLNMRVKFRSHLIFINYISAVWLRNVTLPSQILDNLKHQKIIIFSHPYKQLRSTLKSVSKTIFFTSGIIRRFLKFSTKSSKKNKIISTKLINVTYLAASQVDNHIDCAIKIKKSFTYLKKIISDLRNHTPFFKKVTILIYTPVINFGFIKIKRIGAIKKKLKKRIHNHI